MHSNDLNYIAFSTGCFQQSLNGQIAIHRQARNDFDSIGAVSGYILNGIGDLKCS